MDNMPKNNKIIVSPSANVVKANEFADSGNFIRIAQNALKLPDLELAIEKEVIRRLRAGQAVTVNDYIALRGDVRNTTLHALSSRNDLGDSTWDSVQVVADEHGLGLMFVQASEKDGTPSDDSSCAYMKKEVTIDILNVVLHRAEPKIAVSLMHLFTGQSQLERTKHLLNSKRIEYKSGE